MVVGTRLPARHLFGVVGRGGWGSHVEARCRWLRQIPGARLKAPSHSSRLISFSREWNYIKDRQRQMSCTLGTTLYTGRWDWKGRVFETKLGARRTAAAGSRAGVGIDIEA